MEFHRKKGIFDTFTNFNLNCVHLSRNKLFYDVMKQTVMSLTARALHDIMS